MRLLAARAPTLASRIERPPISRNCFGRSAPRRRPRPPAAMMAETNMRVRDCTITGRAMVEAVIVSSVRTPLAKSHRGSFNITRPDDLAAHAIVEALKKVPALDPTTIEEVLLDRGQPHEPHGHNVAREAALRAGVHVTTAAVDRHQFSKP